MYRKPLSRAAAVVVAVLLMVYPADWLIWRIRSAFGAGMDSVTISESLAITLKGSHFEVYDPTVSTVACSRSLLPEAGAGACWWLRQHSQQVTQY